MTDTKEILEIEQREAEAKLSGFVSPYVKRARKLGFKLEFGIEPVTFFTQGIAVVLREVTIRAVPNSDRAKSACTVDGTLHTIEAKDRYAMLPDFEDCLAGVLEVALQTAKDAL